MDAADNTALELERAEQRFLQSLASTNPIIQPSAKTCIECGDDIPEKRRQYIKGVQLCVECQALRERK